jgi:aspartate/methionine/tyrosine aminotransferase
MSVAAPLNPDLLDTASPPIPEARGWAEAYDGSLGPLINLSQAMPGDPPPPEMLTWHSEAASTPSAAEYGPIMGDVALREAYAADQSRFYGSPILPANIAITAGCNQAFVTTMMAVAQAGDNVLLPIPWYFNHEMTLNMLGIGARPLPCAPAAGFVPDAGEAEALLDARTRAIVLVTPNNPTGAVYPASTIAAFAALCARRGLWLIIDETYRDFLPDGMGRPHDLFAGAGWQDNVIQLYSFSKAYAVPGWRLGAITAGEATLGQIAKVLDCIQISPSRAGQVAVAQAVEPMRDIRAANRSEINGRAMAFRQALAPLNNWQVESCGAYFAYLRHPFTGIPAVTVARRLAQERGVLMLPGPYFGPEQDPFLRVAVANVGRDALGELGQRLAGFNLA